MHPLFQALCLIIFSGILPYLNKTADSDAVFSKVSPLAIFAGNKIGEKYHFTFYGKEALWTKDGHEGVPEGQKRWPHVAWYCSRVAPPKIGLGHRLASGLRRTPSYVRKNAFPRGGGAFAKHTAATTTIFISGID